MGKPFSYAAETDAPAHMAAAAIIERPQCKLSRFFMKNIGRLFALALIWAALGPALAADPVYPSGLRVGLVPIEGLVLSKTFPGFETEDPVTGFESRERSAEEGINQ